MTRQAPQFLQLFLSVLLGCLLASCTVIRQDKIGEDSMPHSSVLPATVICLLSACDAQFSDRAQKAGTSASEEGAVDAEQTATATPTLNIPVTGGTVPVPDVVPDDTPPD